ncbi:MAG: SRPBCC family protein [Bacteroidia bacterium]|nr:SRPBCC family protein [Bacteroidia bacterium]
MKILLIIILVVVSIVALLLLLALFVKKDYFVQREILVNTSIDDVFEYLRFLRKQEKFSKWVMADPDMKKEFKGTDGEPGFVYVWDSKKRAGAGEQILVSLERPTRLNMEVHFIRPFKAIAKTPFILEDKGNGQTLIKWEMHSAVNYPMNAMLLFFTADKMLGPDMEESLNNLKRILEK